MEEWTTKVNPSYLNWLTGLLPERRSPLTRVILHQLREMQIGSKVEEAYCQLSRLKPTVVLEHLWSEKLEPLKKRPCSYDHEESKKRSEKLEPLKKRPWSYDHEESKKRSEKLEPLKKRPCSYDHEESKKRSEKLEPLKKRPCSYDHEESKKRSEKLEPLKKRPCSYDHEESKKRSEKLEPLKKRPCSYDHEESKKRSEKLEPLKKRPCSYDHEESKKRSEKLEPLKKRPCSYDHEESKKRRKLEHGLPSKENVQGGTPRSNVDYTRNTPPLTPSEVNHRCEDLYMTPPRKAASPFWKETPVASHSTDMTSTSGVLKEEEPSCPSSISPNFELIKKVKVERSVSAVGHLPSLSDGYLVEFKEESHKLTPVTLSLVKPQIVKQEPDSKPALLKLVPDVSESKPNILFQKESKVPQMECISSDDPKDQENRSTEQEPDRKPVLLKLVPDVSESKPNILFQKESKVPQMECISSDDPKDQENRSTEQEPDRKPVLLKLVPDVSESKPNILFQKEGKVPQMECISSDDPKDQENRSTEQEPDRNPVLLKLVPDVSEVLLKLVPDVGEGKPNILFQKESKGLVGILSEDTIDSFQDEKQHVSCQKRQAFRHFRLKYKPNQKISVHFDPKNWSKSFFLKMLTKEELLYQSEVEERVLKCLSVCAQFGTRDETASVSTVQAHQSSRLSSVSTVLNKAKQYPRHSVASVTGANHQLLRHSVRSVATAANRSHHPRFTNYSNPRYHSQPYPRNCYGQWYPRRGHYPPYM